MAAASLCWPANYERSEHRADFGQQRILSSVKLAVPNAILLVLDPSNAAAAIPEYEALISHTDSCVSVGTQADVDGETEVSLSRVGPAGLSLAFDGHVLTPSGSIGVETSEGASLGRIDGLTSRTKVAVWVDDNRWPSRVAIVVVDE